MRGTPQFLPVDIELVRVIRREILRLLAMVEVAAATNAVCELRQALANHVR